MVIFPLQFRVNLAASLTLTGLFLGFSSLSASSFFQVPKEEECSFQLTVETTAAWKSSSYTIQYTYRNSPLLQMLYSVAYTCTSSRKPVPRPFFWVPGQAWQVTREQGRGSSGCACDTGNIAISLVGKTWKYQRVAWGIARISMVKP